MGAFRKPLARGAKYAGACVALTGAAYAIYAGATWLRYGRSRRAAADDALLDRFMPAYEIVEQHGIRVNAPADVTFAAACDTSLEDSAIVRAIFRTREMLMRSSTSRPKTRQPLLEQMAALGWGLLAEIPGRELVFGAVAQPLRSDVVFRALAPAALAAFQERGFVKIAWTLRVDAEDGESVSGQKRGRWHRMRRRGRALGCTGRWFRWGLF